ncbi:hypothetical protein D9M70_157300 [compost metagenome]
MLRRCSHCSYALLFVKSLVFSKNLVIAFFIEPRNFASGSLKISDHGSIQRS